MGRSWWSSAWRFVVAGGINTAVTAGVLSLAALVMDPRLAYALAFGLGVGIAVYLAGGFVFGVRLTRRLVTLYVLMYGVVFLIGLGVVALAMRAGAPPQASGLVVVVTAPLTFIGGRLLLVSRSTETTEKMP